MMETADICLLRPDLPSTRLSVSSFYPGKCFPTEAKQNYTSENGTLTPLFYLERLFFVVCLLLWSK